MRGSLVFKQKVLTNLEGIEKLVKETKTLLEKDDVNYKVADTDESESEAEVEYNNLGQLAGNVQTSRKIIKATDRQPSKYSFRFGPFGYNFSVPPPGDFKTKFDKSIEEGRAEQLLPENAEKEYIIEKIYAISPEYTLEDGRVVRYILVKYKVHCVASFCFCFRRL